MSATRILALYVLALLVLGYFAHRAAVARAAERERTARMEAALPYLTDMADWDALGGLCDYIDAEDQALVIFQSPDLASALIVAEAERYCAEDAGSGDAS